MSIQAERGAKYWDSYYCKPSPIAEEVGTEWICNIEEVLQIFPLQYLLQKFALHLQVLEVGCGDSHLLEEIHAYFTEHHKCCSFVATDISQVAIEKLNNRFRHRQVANIKAIEMDATNMTMFNNSSVSCVIDKGMSDTLQFRARNKDAVNLQKKLFTEVFRVLDDGGVYVIITPKRRVRYLREALTPWAKITRHVIHRDFNLVESCPNLPLDTGITSSLESMELSCMHPMLSEESVVDELSPDARAVDTKPSCAKLVYRQRSTAQEMREQSAACYVYLCYKAVPVPPVPPDSDPPGRTKDLVPNPRKVSKSDRNSGLCLQWRSSGVCSFGAGCRFIHDEVSVLC